MSTRALTVALLLWGGLAGADAPWYESYDAGVKAVQARQWPAAETRLRAALKDGPRPGRQIRAYGMRFVDYFPDYYLGLACYHQEKWREAADAFRRMEATGLFAKGDTEYQTMSELAEKASAHLSASAASATAATAAPTVAASAAPAATAPPAVVVASATLLPPTPAAARPTSLARAAAPPAESGDTEQERAGIEWFFRGRYEVALQILEAVPAPRRSARGVFYLACSNAAAGLLKGPDGADLIAAARAQFAEARRRGLRPTAEERYISPRILALARNAP